MDPDGFRFGKPTVVTWDEFEAARGVCTLIHRSEVATPEPASALDVERLYDEAEDAAPDLWAVSLVKLGPFGWRALVQPDEPGSVAEEAVDGRGQTQEAALTALIARLAAEEQT